MDLFMAALTLAWASSYKSPYSSLYRLAAAGVTAISLSAILSLGSTLAPKGGLVRIISKRP